MVMNPIMLMVLNADHWVPNFEDDTLTNPGSWQFVRKDEVSFDLYGDESDHVGGADHWVAAALSILVSSIITILSTIVITILTIEIIRLGSEKFSAPLPPLS